MEARLCISNQRCINVFSSLASGQDGCCLLRLRLAFSPTLDQLSAVLPQVLAIAYRWIGNVVAHGALPQHAVECVGMNTVGIGEVKAFCLCRPPCRVV